MITIVCDASALIDLDKTGLQLAMFRMPYCYVIPDRVARELQQLPRSQPQELYRNGLQVVRLSREETSHAFSLSGSHSSLTFPDCILLAYAGNKKNCILLTADRKLRSLAERMSIKAHGTLWLLEKLLAAKTVNPSVLQKALLALKKDPRVFLPKTEIDRLIRKCAGSRT